jgi:hypothetical protein
MGSQCVGRLMPDLFAFALRSLRLRQELASGVNGHGGMGYGAMGIRNLIISLLPCFLLPFEFASCFTWGDPKTALVSPAPLRVRQLLHLGRPQDRTGLTCSL